MHNTPPRSSLKPSRIYNEFKKAKPTVGLSPDVTPSFAFPLDQLCRLGVHVGAIEVEIHFQLLIEH